MMDTVFLKILNMSITASWVVLAVLLLRLLFKKAPKWISCVLWALVALRLVLPFSIESIFSLIPSSEVIHPSVDHTSPYIDTGISVIDRPVNDYIGDRYFESVATPADHTVNLLHILCILWIVGIVLMLLYTTVSYLRLRRKVREALPVKENLFLCDRIDTPFILGILRPRIYLPSALGEQDTDYVIAHERAHLERGDHLWKPLGFFLLSIYWFHPAMWLAYLLLCRDIEAACDEKVIREQGEEIKRPYSEALIRCSVSRGAIAACPLAFGEVAVKGRVKNVLNYKKPAFWVILVAVIAIVAGAVCLLTNPGSKTPGTDSGNVKVLGTGSDRRDVSIDVVGFRTDNGELKLTIHWNNGSGDILIYGEPFEIYRKDGTGWQKIASDTAWDLVGYLVNPGSTEALFSPDASEKEYRLTSYCSFTGDETYRFVTDYFFEKDHSTRYTVWVDFELSGPVLSPGDRADRLIAMLETALSDAGIDAAPAVDTMNDLLLSGRRQHIDLKNGREGISIYRYESEEAARTEAEYISPSGYEIRKPGADNSGEMVMVDFVFAPHWYLCGNVILLYVGQDGRIPPLLEALGGVRVTEIPRR